jgi:hypothetical protein
VYILQARLSVPGGQTEGRPQAHGAADKLQGSLVHPEIKWGKAKYSTEILTLFLYKNKGDHTDIKNESPDLEFSKLSECKILTLKCVLFFKKGLALIQHYFPETELFIVPDP